MPGGTAQANLYAVSCATATRCLSVGTYIGTRDGEPLSEQMNGHTWTAQTTIPLPARGKGGYLDGVSCSSASSCIAVVTQTENGANGHPLAEYWNGNSWAVQPTTPDKQDEALAGVACVSATTCTAVGNYAQGKASNLLPLAEQS